MKRFLISLGLLLVTCSPSVFATSEDEDREHQNLCNLYFSAYALEMPEIIADLGIERTLIYLKQNREEALKDPNTSNRVALLSGLDKMIEQFQKEHVDILGSDYLSIYDLMLLHTVNTLNTEIKTAQMKGVDRMLLVKSLHLQIEKILLDPDTTEKRATLKGMHTVRDRLLAEEEEEEEKQFYQQTRLRLADADFENQPPDEILAALRSHGINTADDTAGGRGARRAMKDSIKEFLDKRKPSK